MYGSCFPVAFDDGAGRVGLVIFHLMWFSSDVIFGFFVFFLFAVVIRTPEVRVKFWIGLSVDMRD